MGGWEERQKRNPLFHQSTQADLRAFTKNKAKGIAHSAHQSSYPSNTTNQVKNTLHFYSTVD